MKAVFPEDLTINYAALKWTPEVKFCLAFFQVVFIVAFVLLVLKHLKHHRRYAKMNIPWIKSFVEKLDSASLLSRVSFTMCKIKGHLILEWLAFRNEFPSRMKFVLHSHGRFNMSSFLSQIVSWPSLSAILHWKRYPRATRLRLHGLRFSFQTVVRFHLIWYQNKRFIRTENRNELISESDL